MTSADWSVDAEADDPDQVHDPCRSGGGPGGTQVTCTGTLAGAGGTQGTGTGTPAESSGTVTGTLADGWNARASHWNADCDQWNTH